MKTFNMLRFLEMSIQAFVLASIWRGASAMAVTGASTEQLGLLQNPEPFAISITTLAVIGSVAASQIRSGRWRKLHKVIHKEQAQPADEPLPLPNHYVHIIENLRKQVIELTEEKNRLNLLLQEKNARLRRDPLTGVFNRLAYEEQLQQEFHRWSRFGNPLAFLIWDIDNFKQINDQYGHAVGDEVLRSIARQLIARIRKTDFVARYGGEEFIMLLPGADAQAALRLANQIRINIAETGFQNGEINLPVTISCGLSSFEPGDSPQSVFRRADQALYRAKQAGRNCCLVS